MSSATKQYISGAVCVLCALFMAFCIQRMIPYGITGEVGKVKLYFALTILAFIPSLASGIAYYYYRSRSKQGNDLERMRVEATMLAHAGQKHTEPTQAGSESSRFSDRKKS